MVTRETFLGWGPDELEEVSCDLCNSREATPVFVRADGLRMVECATCGLTFLSPRPLRSLIARLYEEDYFVKPGQGARVGWNDYFSPANVALLQKLGRERLDLVFGTDSLVGLSVLEVGCAGGDVCRMMADRGASTVGLDVSADVIRRARVRFPHLTFHDGEVATFQQDSFDAIIAFEVVEHTPSPVAFMQELRRRVRPDGVIALSTPNLECGRRVGIERWTGSTTSFEHLYFFDPSSFEKCAAKAGLRVEAWYTGLGTGEVPRTESGAHRTMRAIAQRMGLLGVVRRVRFRHSATQQDVRYSVAGSNHNLLAVLRRTRS